MKLIKQDEDGVKVKWKVDGKCVNVVLKLTWEVQSKIETLYGEAHQETP